MKLHLQIRATTKIDASSNESTSANYTVYYYDKEQLVGTTKLWVDHLKIGFRPHCLINVGEMQVPSTFNKATLMFQTKRCICRYFWRNIISQKVYIWSDATVCEMDFSNAKNGDHQRLTMSKTIREMINYISEKYYGVADDKATDQAPKIVYLRQDLIQSIPFFVAANPLHRDGLGLINFGRVYGIDLLV